MLSEKKLSKFLIKYVFNPTIVFFIYFAFIALFGFTGKQLLIFYVVFFPWLFIILLFFYIPFMMFLFRISEMENSTKINHVLEHGTIHFLNQIYGKGVKIGGSSLKGGFRIYGGVKSKRDINTAFERLKSYIDEGKKSAVLSKFCGSSTHILGGISFILLTITFIVFLCFNFDLFIVNIILLTNVIFYFLFRYPIGKYFQKSFTMCFDFFNPRILSIEKVPKTGVWERNPVYFVKTYFEI